LTRNELAVARVHAMPGFDEARVVALAALASSDGGQDPVDAAIHAAEASSVAANATRPRLLAFVPFDPATRTCEATVEDASGPLRVVKGAFASVLATVAASPAVIAEANAAATELEDRGLRVLAVAAGPSGALALVGLVALADPPRADSKALVAELQRLGVRTVMVTGDAAANAVIVARAVGLDGAVCPASAVPAGTRPETFAVFAGVLPEDKFKLVDTFQRAGHTVGMCGDGANDAPALRQAQIGIAVSTATDVAKSAAGVVLTEPGLGGIVAAVTEGRVTFQRILTYTLNSIVKKVVNVLLLVLGLMFTGHAILTPMLIVFVMITGDFLAMAVTTDRVTPSRLPNAWRIGSLTLAGVVLGTCLLAFCAAVLAIGRFELGLGDAMTTLAFVTLVFGGQATMYAIRERRHLWSSRPSRWLVAATTADVAIASTLAVSGIAMPALPVAIVAATLAGAAGFAFVLDAVHARLEALISGGFQR
jgi:H+-transporting ATPase